MEPVWTHAIVQNRLDMMIAMVATDMMNPVEDVLGTKGRQRRLRSPSVIRKKNAEIVAFVVAMIKAVEALILISIGKRQNARPVERNIGPMILAGRNIRMGRVAIPVADVLIVTERN